MSEEAEEIERLRSRVKELEEENDEARAGRDFYEAEWMIQERVYRELRDAIQDAGFSTMYFDQELRAFPKTVKACKLRDRIAEVCYDFARHLRRCPMPDSPQFNGWSRVGDGYLNKLRAIDFRRFQKEMDRR